MCLFQCLLFLYSSHVPYNHPHRHNRDIGVNHGGMLYDRDKPPLRPRFGHEPRNEKCRGIGKHERQPEIEAHGIERSAAKQGVHKALHSACRTAQSGKQLDGTLRSEPRSRWVDEIEARPYASCQRRNQG